jgi:hypothetical protein
MKGYNIAPLDRVLPSSRKAPPVEPYGEYVLFGTPEIYLKISLRRSTLKCGIDTCGVA